MEGTKGALYVTNGAFLSGTSGKPSFVKIPPRTRGDPDSDLRTSPQRAR